LLWSFELRSGTGTIDGLVPDARPCAYDDGAHTLSLSNKLTLAAEAENANHPVSRIELTLKITEALPFSNAAAHLEIWQAVEVTLEAAISFSIE
jgi:hypothetical protein